MTRNKGAIETVHQLLVIYVCGVHPTSTREVVCLKFHAESLEMVVKLAEAGVCSIHPITLVYWVETSADNKFWVVCGWVWCTISEQEACTALKFAYIVYFCVRTVVHLLLPLLYSVFNVWCRYRGLRPGFINPLYFVMCYAIGKMLIYNVGYNPPGDNPPPWYSAYLGDFPLTLLTFRLSDANSSDL